MSIGLQGVTEASTAVILVLSILLSVFLTMNYMSRRASSYASWSSGLWLFTVGVALELLFSIGYYSQIMIRVYLWTVAVLVQMLAIGSLQLTQYRRVKAGYYVFSVASVIFLTYALAVSSIGNLISGYVVYGALPLLVTVASSVLTFPAAVILIVVAALSYRKSHSNKMLSIIIGVIVVSVAGTLYIAKFPAFLYFAEFAGILLLWAGFFTPSGRGRRTVHTA